MQLRIISQHLIHIKILIQILHLILRRIIHILIRPRSIIPNLIKRIHNGLTPKILIDLYTSPPQYVIRTVRVLV